ncbi:MAG TPA: helix-turn-helix transcriptional regulator [Microbacteriaceae bacterium]|nr:helix-turn-helix transcriptional regulator [Microbacteriaceae bacterium]
MDSPTIAAPARPAAPRASAGGTVRLTRTQAELLRMIAQGYSNNEIARRRGVTVSAIEQLATSVYKAFDLNGNDGISARVEATRIFIMEYGIPPRDA